MAWCIMFLFIEILQTFQCKDNVWLFLSCLRNKTHMLHIFKFWPNLLNSMNVRPAQMVVGWVSVCLWRWHCVKLSKGGPVFCWWAARSVHGLPDLGQHAVGGALSPECEWGAPVTRGRALLVARWVSTTLRTHAGTVSSNCPLNAQPAPQGWR